jgi:hypothetical protein
MEPRTGNPGSGLNSHTSLNAQPLHTRQTPSAIDLCVVSCHLPRPHWKGPSGAFPGGASAYWTGLGPDDSILALRDISQQDLYALEMKFP